MWIYSMLSLFATFNFRAYVKCKRKGEWAHREIKQETNSLGVAGYWH